MKRRQIPLLAGNLRPPCCKIGNWHTETIVHLWLQPAYVQGLHVLIGVGVNLQGHRRIVNLTECGPQDQSRMEAVLDDLSVRGLGSAMLVTIPGNVALQAAVSCVWGTRAWVQRCLNTVMDEALGGSGSRSGHAVSSPPPAGLANL